MNPQQLLALFIPLALAAPLLPTIGEPFLWFEAYIYQATEALVVFAHGGTPLSFHVNFSGGAGTEFRGSDEVFVMFASRIATVFWSLMFFIVPTSRPAWLSVTGAVSLLLFVSLAWPFWGTGGSTLAIALVIDAIIIVIFYFRHVTVVGIIGKFLAVLLCLSGPRLALMALLTDSRGSVDDIAGPLQVSPLAVVAIWTGIAVMGIAVMFAIESRVEPRQLRR